MRNKLKILMVAPQPFFSARGTPFSVLHRIRALLELGHEVDLVTYGYGEDIDLEGLTILRSRALPFIKKIKIGPSIPKIFLDLLLYLDTRRALKNKQYDVFHSHEEAAFFALRFSRKNAIPHIYDMHSSLPLQLSNFKAYNLGLFKRIFERLENKVLASSDAVITICDELAQIVEQEQPNKPHLMIENIGDDRKVFSASDKDWRTELGIGDQPVLLYTGTFEAYQGIDLLIDSLPEVFAEFPNAIALLVGGNPEQVEKYANYAAAADIDKQRLRFTGTVHPSHIPAMIDMATVIVSPRSRGTNTPLKIYNYCRTGKPLVATDRLTHTQILNADISCLVEATPAAFAQGTIKVLSDESYAKTIADAAQAFAAEHFSDEKYIQMVDDIYHSMLSNLPSDHVLSLATAH